MSSILSALLPVFSLILVGYIFQRTNFPGAGFWQPATTLTYYALLPALLISKLANVDLGKFDVESMIIAILVGIGVVTLMVLGLNRIWRFSGPTLTSVLQGGIRANTYVGLATALTLLGDAGLAIVALVQVVLVLGANLICVVALAYYVPGNQSSPKHVFRAVLRNPLIVACLVGIVLSVTGLGLSMPLQSILDVFSQAALPMGLLLVGSGLRLNSFARAWRPILVSGTAKLVVLPIIVVIVAQMLQLNGIALIALVIVATLPSSASSYVLAQQMGGDSRLMASILTVETACAAVTMPLLLSVVV